MSHFWIVPTLMLMVLGLIAMNAGFCRRGFALTGLFKSLVVLFLSLSMFIIIFPFFHKITGFILPGELQLVISALFAAIACIIVLSSGIEKLSIESVFIGVFIWLLLVYAPFYFLTLPEGFFVKTWSFRDFAGGLLIHTTTGASALGLAAIKGRRKEFFNLKKSSQLGFFGLGALLVFLGWIGFNASGSQIDDEIIHAIKTTILAGSQGFIFWSLLDRVHTPQRFSIKGSCFGMISGLVAITPGAGWLALETSMLVGALAAVLGFYTALFVEKALRIDDEMKIFASHFAPSWLGALFVSGHFSSWSFQRDILLPVLTAGYCFIVTVGIYVLIDKLFPISLNLSKKQEEESPDIFLLGESFTEI